MMELKGKYNEAIVYTDNIDSNTIGQIIELCNEESLKDSIIRIMPDCHMGRGCTIGTTMTIKDKIVPNLVGVDIGCGMMAVTIGKTIDLELMDSIIRKYVPNGFSVYSKKLKIPKSMDVNLNELKCVDEINIDRAYKSIGTLGGGNHFIEIGKDENGLLWLIVHTGSRNLGKQIADYYQQKAIEYCKDKYQLLKDYAIKDLKDNGQEHLIKETIANIKKPQDSLCYLEGVLMEDYLHDMAIAQKYAKLNRMAIIATILNKYSESDRYFVDFNFRSVIKAVEESGLECIHNYIDLNSMILRKGAISARKLEPVIIPINMRDGIIIGVGKGNLKWNNSAPHGAGRILSRGQAKREISLEEYKKSMEGIFTTCVNTATLDEAPQAYKPMEEIIENIKDTVTIKKILKPVYNFKSN